MDKVALDKFAVELLAKVSKTLEDQKLLVVKYEGAIEGIKLFMQELDKEQVEKAGLDEGQVSE